VDTRWTETAGRGQHCLLRTDRLDCAAGVRRYERVFYCTAPHQGGRRRRVARPCGRAQRRPTGAAQAHSSLLRMGWVL